MGAFDVVHLENEPTFDTRTKTGRSGLLVIPTDTELEPLNPIAGLRKNLGDFHFPTQYSVSRIKSFCRVQNDNIGP